MQTMIQRSIMRAALACGLSCGVLVASGCGSTQTFATPQDAMKAVADIAGKHDKTKVDQIFGPGATKVIWSGDEVADREDGARVGEMIRQRVHLTPRDDGTTVAFVGNDDWPFPFPLEQTKEGRWRFDVAAGREELEN